MNAHADLQVSCSKVCRQPLLWLQANWLNITDVFDITAAIFIASYRKKHTAAVERVFVYK